MPLKGLAARRGMSWEMSFDTVTNICIRRLLQQKGLRVYYNNLITVAQSNGENLSMLPKMANRHGLIAGATGTGKTITLKVMAEAFSDAGVPVFLADVKGDLAGMCMRGQDSEDMQERIKSFGLEDMGFAYKSYPTRFWDIYGKKGMPLRTTITEFGPELLARLLGLNQIQSDIMNIVFKICDDEGLLLIDTKDLKAALNYAGENQDKYKADYGAIAKNSVSAIIRAIVALEDKGASDFFGEPALDINDWIATDGDGRGYINILDSQSLINDGMLYSTFMLWLLSELFEIMPEVGDQEKPRLVFFFDEAHLLFDGAPKVLLQKIEQVVKLVRSKGVGVYFATQNPADIPGGVLAQLGNKVQHALRAYTPAEKKGVKAAAESFRENPEFSTYDAIQELGTGEAVVSFLQEDGAPDIVRKAKILPPQSQMGTIDDNMRNQIIASDSLRSKYSVETQDRDSAYEFLMRRGQEEQKAEAEAEKAKAEQKEAEKRDKAVNSAKSKVAQSAAGTLGREIGNAFGGTLGGKFGKKLGGNIGAQIGRGIMQTLFRK